MRMLFVNDDGCFSEGLHAVAALFSKEHEVCVVAPNEQKSGFSHSLSLKPRGIPYQKITGYDYPVYSVCGTPVDCVKVGINYLFKAPDIIFSGINRGENLGSDIMYSGTCSAAADAAHVGIRAIALSLDCDHHSPDIDYGKCAAWVHDNLNKLCSIDFPRGVMFNINFPRGDFAGVKVVRMNTQDTFTDIYKEENGVLYPDGRRDYNKLKRNNDEFYCKKGYITITPIRTDRTDGGTLAKLKKAGFCV